MEGKRQKMLRSDREECDLLNVLSFVILLWKVYCYCSNYFEENLPYV